MNIVIFLSCFLQGIRLNLWWNALIYAPIATCRKGVDLLAQLIQKLSEELEFEEAPHPEEGSVYHVPVHAELTVRIQELDPGISFWARIGPCPLDRREELFILLMKANLLGQGTGNSTIGLDENENFLTLSSILPYDMNYKAFKDALEDFTNYREYWKNELIRHKET